MGLLNVLGIEAGKEIVVGAGKAVSNVMDRFWPKKMTEAEKFEKIKAVMDVDLRREGIEVEDVNKAREMWMTFLRTQKLPWLARFLNAIFRPIAGFMALFYLTDKFWSQAVKVFYPSFHWVLIERDPVTDGAVTLIIFFFFGYRHKAKKEGLTSVG